MSEFWALILGFVVGVVVCQVFNFWVMGGGLKGGLRFLWTGK